MPARRVTLVRHGETTGRSSVRYYGSTDVQLAPLGEAQMRRVAAAVAGVRYDSVFSSTLRRSRRSAEIVAPSGSAVRAVPAFDEVDFGRWEGLTKEEIAARDPELFAEWRAAPQMFVYPDGECRRAFGERVVAGFDAIAAAEPAGEWLMVLHRGVIAVVLDHLIGREAWQHAPIDLGSIHVVAFDGARWFAERLEVVP
jgi:broad specificity phosphatase PhoE